MNNRVNCYDVARMAGVSQATVSYVLSRRQGKKIREETRLKVIKAAETLGYQPSLAAKTLATGKTGTIALWVQLTHQNVYNHVTGEIARLARASGLHVMIVQISTETTDSLGKIGMLSPTNVDAILAHDATALVNEILDTRRGVPPIISFGPAFSDRTDHVGIDIRGGSLTAASHLYSIGCKRVAYAGHHDYLHEYDARYIAYMQAAKEAGAEPILIPLDNTDYEAGYQAILAHVSRENYPDGIFCWNDEVAIGANRALSDLGLHVPNDVAIIGSDGIRETAYCLPTISTVAQPFAEMCELIWTYLMHRLENPEAPIQGSVLPMPLIQRVSTSR